VDIKLLTPPNAKGVGLMPYIKPRPPLVLATLRGLAERTGCRQSVQR
jgi:hypothetical protein